PEVPIFSFSAKFTSKPSSPQNGCWIIVYLVADELFKSIVHLDLIHRPQCAEKVLCVVVQCLLNGEVVHHERECDVPGLVTEQARRVSSRVVAVSGEVTHQADLVEEPSLWESIHSLIRSGVYVAALLVSMLIEKAVLLLRLDRYLAQHDLDIDWTGHGRVEIKVFYVSRQRLLALGHDGVE
ncbi:hypothetical protein B484DRAFT_463539, partial [Ochromonadaceae sp. CCMP2298]